LERAYAKLTLATCSNAPSYGGILLTYCFAWINGILKTC